MQAEETVISQLMARLVTDLRRNHAKEADHLAYQITQEMSLTSALANPQSSLWGAIPIEILESTPEGRSYLVIIDTFVRDSARLHHCIPPLGGTGNTGVLTTTVATTENPAQVSEYMNEVLNMDVFAGIDPLALLSNPEKLQEFSGNVQKVIDNGTLDVKKLETEMETILGQFSSSGEGNEIFDVIRTNPMLADAMSMMMQSPPPE